MKAVIIGGTVSAMEAAVHLRNAGHDVTLVVSSTYLGEDFTGTWKYFPLEKQQEGKERLKTLLPGYQLNHEEILLNGSLKKQFLNAMDCADISVLFMTRAAGVKSTDGRITHVLLADKLGAFYEPCDLLIDGTLYHELSHLLSGMPICIRAGSRASLSLEYMGVDRLPEAPEGGGWSCVRGAASADHAFIIAEHAFENDMSPEDARRRLTKTLTEAAERISSSSLNTGARLINSISPMICTEIAPPSDRPYANLYLPSELAEGASLRPVSGSAKPGIRKISCDVLVAGAGTAGMRAALAADRENCSVCLAEFFTTLGGTRTVGGVQPPYDGNRNSLFLGMWKDIHSFAARTGGLKDGRTSAASEALLYEKYLAESRITLLRPVIAFEVRTENRLIKSVLFAAPDGIYELEAKTIIDATGDADIAAFAGVKTMYGDAELGATQNYSQFHVTSGTPYDVPMADQDVMNQTDRSEWARCIRQNTQRCAPFDIVEMLTVRESRRIEGRDTVRLSDVYRNRRPKDAIYDCFSDYDTHSRCFSEIGRYSVLPSHAPVKFVSVPFGALLPREIDNLLVCAKGVSAEQEAAAHMRMSPDIMCIGHIAGVIAGRCAKSGTHVPQADLTDIQNQMHRLGALVRKPAAEDFFENTAQMLAARLAAGDESAFSEALLCNWEELPGLLQEIRAAGAESRHCLVSMVLLYYGDVSCAPEIAEELDRLNREYGVKPRRDVYHSKIIMGGDVTGRDPYFKIISLVMLLAKNGWRDSIPLIESVMKNTCIGEEFMIPSAAHPIVRPDMHVHGNFDRMLTLAHAAILMPSEHFASPLMHLYQLNAENANRAPVFYNAWLEFRLAHAAYLCGHPAAEELLCGMLSSPYFVIRQGAQKVLNHQNRPQSASVT